MLSAWCIDSDGFGRGLGGLFDDLLTVNLSSDAEEDEFRKRMQRRKKNRGRSM